ALRVRNHDLTNGSRESSSPGRGACAAPA
ncbi:unnamed protein product, partial [Rotaria socialis]